MEVARVELYRYTLPLQGSLSLAGTTLAERQGLLVRLQTCDGAVGWGEAAPLPGFSSETLTRVILEGRRVASVLTGLSLRDSYSGLRELWGRLPVGAVAPSLRFAIESALLELRAAARGTGVARLLGGRSIVELNALVTDAADPSDQGERLRTAGYRAVKLKVGRRDLDTDARRVRTLSGVLDDTVSLRLDANRAWTYDEAVTFGKAIRDVPIAYIEEPLSDPARLSEFVTATGHPVALDETTREIEPDALVEHNPRAVVLKPTLLGGRRTLRWARRAREYGAVPVVSAAYESGVGLRMLVALAAALSDVPAGISTYDALAADVLDPPLDLDHPTVAATEGEQSQVDSSMLDPLPVSHS